MADDVALVIVMGTLALLADLSAYLWALLVTRRGP
jgi:hypothetical protein